MRLKHVLVSLAVFGLVGLSLSLLRLDASAAGSTGASQALPRRSGAFPVRPAARDAPARVREREEPPKAQRGVEVLKTSPAEPWSSRRDQVVAAIAHAFDGYAAHAWGQDELRPLSRSGKNTFCGTGATIVDSLSTLWLANLTERFNKAADWALSRDYAHTLNGCNLFETNIRVVGGLLSAGALSGRPEFFRQAEVVVKQMLPSFNTPSGLPCNNFPGGADCSTANLAEVGTLSLEFVYLSHVTEDPTYARAAERVARSLALARNGSSCELTGLYASNLNTHDGSALGCSGSVGGGADSWYEYMIKLYLLTNSHDSFDSYRRMWEAHTEGALKYLVRCSEHGHLFVTTFPGGSTLEHLACYFPGNLMLGDHARFHKVAAGLTESCAALYTGTRSHLGADGASWSSPREGATCSHAPKKHTDLAATGDMSISSPSNLQRPEVVEALFHMWHYGGGDDYWREIGWGIFQAMDANTRVPEAGYASVVSVDAEPVVLDDIQQSFFIAEELKYMLLLFSEKNQALDMDAWVLNTEAHPLPRFTPRYNSTLGDVCTSAPLVCSQAAGSSYTTI